MDQHSLTRATVGAAATVAAFLPLAACSIGGGGGTGAPTATSDAAPSPAPSSGAVPSGPSADPLTGAYADGTYTARGVYGGAPSYMDFTVRLVGGTITDVESEPMPDNNDTSRGYQERFAAALPDEVEGKPIDDLTVGRIAGASGCADGFNAALDRIRAQAAGG